MVKTLITNKVTAIFTMTLGKPIAYAMHALPTAVSRLIRMLPNPESLFLDLSSIVPRNWRDL
jgi:hypothetical protein